LIELLRRAAAATPDGPAIVTDERTHTYAEVLESADRTASALCERGIDRLAICAHDVAGVVVLLAAASLTGTEACQYPAADPSTELVPLLDRLDHRVLVTDRSDLADAAPSVLAIEDLAEASARAPDEPPAERPLLILTTGTTGTPKAARHDWARLLRSVARVSPEPGQRWFLAYGPHQFAGMQVVLHALAFHATLVAPTERRPKDALATMRAHGVTHVSATPTWWRFLLAELHAEGGAAPELEQITLGGEAVPDPLLAQLAAAFPHTRVSQIYAGNEFGPTGSVRDRRAGLDVSILERGDDADVQAKIVDGELWIRSRVGMLGYYGEPAVDPDGWRATGDLVEVVGDRIQFQGRSSDVINVGGVEVHPLPVEELVAAVPGVQLVRVFGRENRLTGAIVAAEVVLLPGADTAEVEAAIREASTSLPAASRPRSIRFVDELAVRGGKVSRR
jgi:acyl-CoA synthetase (AMP-forming)/AMP-acid ligase II